MYAAMETHIQSYSGLLRDDNRVFAQQSLRLLIRIFYLRSAQTTRDVYSILADHVVRYDGSAGLIAPQTRSDRHRRVSCCKNEEK